jgi:hypothetical protein
MWILLAISYMSFHGASGIALMNQEFKTKAKCESARRVLLDLQDHKQIQAACVEK